MPRLLSSLLFAACVAPQALIAQDLRPGFAHRDAGFVGTFGARQQRLELHQQGDGVQGTLDLGLKFEVTARIVGARLVGQAKGVGAMPFAAAFDGDVLQVELDGKVRPMHRLTATVPALLDLGPVAEDPQRQWTVAVYLGADNDLEGSALADLEEMVAALPQPGLEVVVLIDRSARPPRGKDDYSDARVLRLCGKAQGGPEVLARPGELDTGAPAVLASFVAGAFTRYPAPHHAVVLWDHGGGFGGMVLDEEAPGSRTGRSMLGLPGIRAALGTARILVPGLDRLDLLACDACLMAHLELALEVEDLAAFLVGSQASVPTAGFAYDRLLPALAKAADGRAAARACVDTYGQSYSARADSTVTLAAIDLAKVGAVASRLDRIAGRCLAQVEAGWQGAARAVYFAESYQARALRGGPEWAGSVDLCDVLQRLQQVVPAFPAADDLQALRAAVADAVVARHGGEQRGLSRGLSVYAPFLPQALQQAWPGTAFGAGNRWPQLLAAVQARAKAARGPVQFDAVQVRGLPGREATVRPCDGHGLSFAVTGSALVAVEQVDLVRDGDGWVALRRGLVADPRWPRRFGKDAADAMDLRMPEFRDGRNQLQVELPGVQWLVTDNQDTVRATFSTAHPSDQAPIVARARMLTPLSVQLRDVEVHFDRAWWAVSAVYELPRPGGAAVPRLCQPPKGTQFRFRLQTYGDDGKAGEVYTEPLTWNTGLGLLLAADEPGRYHTDLIATTMDGRESSTGIDYAVEANPDLEALGRSFAAFDRDELHGTWEQQEATGPGTFRDTGLQAVVQGPTPIGPGVFAVDAKVDGEVSHQYWVLEGRALPCLRVITEIADGRRFCWWGPVGYGKDDDRPVLLMKAIEVGSIWRWQQSIFDALRVRPKPKGDAGKDR